MAQQTEKITFTVPKELADRISEAAKSESCSRSEFLRKAVDRYIWNRDWDEIHDYARQQAKKTGVRPEDVMDIVRDVRDEYGRNPS